MQGRSSKRTIVRLVAAAGLVAGLVSGTAVASQAAVTAPGSERSVGLPTGTGTKAQPSALEDFGAASYNMEGAQRGDVTPKWSNDIPQLARTHTVVAVQEAGPIPTLDRNGPVWRYQDQVTVRGRTIFHFIRDFGRRGAPMERHVYFMETDPVGHRVNLAMVTENRADNEWITPPDPRMRGARASFGLQFGSTIFNNVHGLSGNGNDMPGMINAIAAGQAGGGRDWAVLGDFNRDPDSLLSARLPDNSHLYRPGRATHIRGGEFDYMVASRSVPLYTGTAMNGISADHLPVEFGVIDPQAAAGFQIGNYHSYNGRLGERVLDIANSSPRNGTHILLYDNHNGANQRFVFQPLGNPGVYLIKNPLTGKCLDMNRGLRTGGGDYLNEWPCDNLPTQDWRVETWTHDPGAAAIVNTYTNDCMDVSRNENRNGSWAVINRCVGSFSQKWTLEYLGSST